MKSENRSWLDYGRIDTDILYENMMKKFVWGGASDPKVNIDYNHRRTLMVIKSRLNYARLAKALAAEGKKEKAVEVLDFCMKALPLSNVPYDPYVADLVEAYFAAGDTSKALAMSDDLSSYYLEMLAYYLKQNPYVISSADYKIRSALQYTSKITEAYSAAEYKKKEDAIAKKLDDIYAEFAKRLSD